MLAKKIAQGEGNLKNSLNPNVAIPPEIKNEISNKLKEINYEESYRSGKDFGPKDSKYITEEIGIIGNASFGLSGTATLGLVGGMNGQEKGKLELSFGNGGVGAYAGIYGMQTTAPYEVLEDPNTTVLSMGYVGGNGLVAGYNKLMIAGGDGRFYDGRMIIFGQGFSLPGLKNVDIVGYGTDFKSVDLPLPSHYNK